MSFQLQGKNTYLNIEHVAISLKCIHFCRISEKTIYLDGKYVELPVKGRFCTRNHRISLQYLIRGLSFWRY